MTCALTVDKEFLSTTNLPTYSFSWGEKSEFTSNELNQNHVEKRNRRAGIKDDSTLC